MEDSDRGRISRDETLMQRTFVIEYLNKVARIRITKIDKG